jgi:hypothetical protein
MKTKVLLLGIGLVLGGLLGAQDIVKNPEKPSSPNAGRVLNLKEELRITDAGGEFFLQYPSILKTSPDGSIYLRDRDELIQMDPRGHFLRNLYKKGQGPGELNYVSGFDPVGDLLLVHSNDPGKLVWFDAQGKAVKEVSLAAAGGRMDYLFHGTGESYFFKRGVPGEVGKAAPVDLPHSLVSITDEGSRTHDLGVFSTKAISVGGAMLWDGLLTAIASGRYLFVASVNPFSIKAFDCREERHLRTFSRPYKRIPRPKEVRASAIISRDGRRFEMPGSEYLEDIVALFAVGDMLWVRTSTRDSEKGILFDVFNIEGQYVDAFYLKTDGRPLAVEGDAVFIAEKTPDETIEIAKYRIVR